MSTEERPDNSAEPASPPSEGFPEWVFDAAYTESRENPLDDLAFASRQSASKNVVELFPIPKKRTSRPVHEESVIESPEEEYEDEALPPATAGRSPEQLEKARRRQAAYIKKLRAKKQRRVVHKRIRATFKLVSTAVLLILIYWVATLSYWRFSPEHVALHGNTLITRQHIQQTLGPLDGLRLYQINPLQVADAIRQEVPYASEVYVRRHLWPVGLDISVVEKPVWGVLYVQTGPRVKTTKSPEGKLTQVVAGKSQQRAVKLLHWDNTTTDLKDFQLTPQAIQAIGHPIKVISGAAPIKSTRLQAYRELVQLLSSRPRQAQLLYLNVSQPENVTARFEGFNVRIGRVDGSVHERVRRLFSVLDAVKEHQHTLQWVDLRWHQQVLFKQKSEAQLAAEAARKAQQQKEQSIPEPESTVGGSLAPTEDAPSLDRPKTQTDKPPQVSHPH